MSFSASSPEERNLNEATWRPYVLNRRCYYEVEEVRNELTSTVDWRGKVP